ncbi:hypothetical protein METSCH_A07370 [Metschnikowia aff. pulcherrima]|uniref:Uncharacterized protein n=1 Tax=Metschnikowia aff. pulcherrima TaxID=2163413 RepID=A0A4P6XFD4_9ASCO|nr:hypothetical protein METSCH_A07370 [Metschnikowia aff. pulcherrima]
MRAWWLEMQRDSEEAQKILAYKTSQIIFSDQCSLKKTILIFKVELIGISNKSLPNYHRNLGDLSVFTSFLGPHCFAHFRFRCSASEKRSWLETHHHSRFFRVPLRFQWHFSRTSFFKAINFFGTTEKNQQIQVLKKPNPDKTKVFACASHPAETVQHKARFFPPRNLTLPLFRQRSF